MMVEYRGYGNSDTVKPGEAGLKKDGHAALKFIAKHPKIDASKLFIFGRSLGGAVAFDLAQYAEENDIPVAGVIVENSKLCTVIFQVLHFGICETLINGMNFLE